MIGGAQEAIHSRPNTYIVVLKKRKGFVRIAMLTGTPIVPVLTFGEVDLYDQPANPPGSAMRRFQEYLKGLTGMSPIFFRGRSQLEWWVPKRRPLTTVGKFIYTIICVIQ